MGVFISFTLYLFVIPFSVGVFISFTLYLLVIPFSVGVFLFLFISFLFSILALLCLFYLGGSLVLVQAKQVRVVLQSFYYKNREGMGSLYTGEVIIKKRMSNNKSRQAGFTASPGRSNIDHVVFQWVLE